MTHNRHNDGLNGAAVRWRRAIGWALLLAGPLAADLPAQELQAELRTWTSKSGKSSTTARLWKVTDEAGHRRVHLMKEGGFGESFSMSWKALSAADIAYVERVTADRRAALHAAGDDVGALRRQLSPTLPAGAPAVSRATLEKVGFLASELLLVDATDKPALEAIALVAELEKRAARPEYVVAQCRGPVDRNAAATKLEALPGELQGVWVMHVTSVDGGATCEPVAENLRSSTALRLAAAAWQHALAVRGQQRSLNVIRVVDRWKRRGFPQVDELRILLRRTCSTACEPPGEQVARRLIGLH
ncbi:MAG: hypothetical protein EBR23_02895 [Planctomycetia bacterium]|nr:hypothetical protein [Planctomycetia bacterium]